jgi:hypothetical protein
MTVSSPPDASPHTIFFKVDNLILRLHLVIAFDDIRVAWWRSRLSTRWPRGGTLSGWRHRRRWCWLWLGGLGRSAVCHAKVDDPMVGALRVGDRLVLRYWIRVSRDNVPGVDEAWDVAETAEGDVDQGVGGAEARFDPDRDRREEDGDKGEEDVGRAHFGRSSVAMKKDWKF